MSLHMAASAGADSYVPCSATSLLEDSPALYDALGTLESKKKRLVLIRIPTGFSASDISKLRISKKHGSACKISGKDFRLVPNDVQGGERLSAAMPTINPKSSDDISLVPISQVWHAEADSTSVPSGSQADFMETAGKRFRAACPIGQPIRQSRRLQKFFPQEQPVQKQQQQSEMPPTKRSKNK